MTRTARQKNYDHGVRAENIATLFLQCKGYKIIARRYKTPGGEIDIIARRGRTLAAVEVKAYARIEDGLRAVNPRTQIRIAQAVNFFLSRHPQYIDYTIRFDMIMYAPPFSLRHLDNAWEARP
jgi:putative endonuclease